MDSELPISELVNRASERIREQVRRTPLEYSPAFSELTGANVFLKCENLQLTGSFKIRGATNKLLSLPENQRTAGLVAASTGNHGKALAMAAQKLDRTATVFVPRNADTGKIAAIRRLGATVELAGADCVDAESAARHFAAQSTGVYVSPYNDPLVVAGQGTIGVELTEQLEPIDAVVASVGGGGLLAGIGGYLKSRNPDCRMVGCSPENSQVMIESLRAGQLLDLPSRDTLSEGTAGGVEAESITFELCRQLVDDVVTVSEQEIRDALIQVLELQGMLVEGAAAVAVASLLKTSQTYRGKNVVVVLCGANIGVDKLRQVLAEPG